MIKDTLYEQYPETYKKPKKSKFKVGDSVSVELTMGSIIHNQEMVDMGIEVLYAEVSKIFPSGAIKVTDPLSYPSYPQHYIVSPRQLRKARKKKAKKLKCDDCGTTENVRNTLCPYQQDVNNKQVEVTLCENCIDERAQDI